MAGGVAELMEQGLDPGSRLLGAPGVKMVGEAPEVLAAMIEVQGLGRPGEAVLDQIPYPDGSIGEDEDFPGPSQAAPHRLRLDHGPEIDDIGIRRDGDDLFLNEHATPGSVGRPVFEAVDDRAFDFLPGDSFQGGRSRLGAPVHPSLANQPAIDHDDQTERRLLRLRERRCGQLHAFVAPGDAPHERMNGVVAYRRAPAGGQFRAFLEGTGGGGIVGESLLELRAQTGPFAQPPLLAHRTVPASRCLRMAPDRTDAHDARYRYQREARLLLALEQEPTSGAHRRDRIGRMLEPRLEPRPRPLAPLFEHFLLHRQECRTHALSPKRYTSFSATAAVCPRSWRPRPRVPPTCTQLAAR